MLKLLPTLIFTLLFIPAAFCGGYDIRTSSVMDEPDVEVLGFYKGSWYAVGFEKPENLNKPSKYKLFKYATGFGTGKISALYPSFGEKTFYLHAAFINNKISLFYARCEKRSDEESLMDEREGHKQLSVIMRQDFDINTLLPDSSARVVFQEQDEHFVSSGIEVAESDDKSKVAVLFKCYYRQYKYMVTITDNKTGEVSSKTFDFKDLKEYLKFMHLRVNNQGEVFIGAKVRDDIVTLNPAKNKPQNTFWFFGVNKQTETPKSFNIASPAGRDQYLGDPLMEILGSGELAVAFDVYTDEKRQALKGFSVYKYDADMSSTGRKEVSPDETFAEQAAVYHVFKKGKEFTNLKLQQILPLEGKNFMLLTEYYDTVANVNKKLPATVERDYLITFRIDENMALKAQHFIGKKQLSSTVDYAFSARGFKKGNDAHIFYNADWEADEEHSMNLQCTKLPANGGPAETKKIVNTSNDFFTRPAHIYYSTDGKVMFKEEKTVEFEFVSREVKLLEITVK